MFFNQAQFFLAPPAFDLLLTRDGIRHVLECLKKHQVMYVVPFCEAFDQFGLMLTYSFLQIPCDTGV